MNMDPTDELLDLPQEPQFTSLILRRNRTELKKVEKISFMNSLPVFLIAHSFSFLFNFS